MTYFFVIGFVIVGIRLWLLIDEQRMINTPPDERTWSDEDLL